jgi:hypothetical protein
MCHSVPYTVYADFELFIVPIAHCSREDDSSHSINVSHHVPASFCYVIVDWTGKAVKEQVLFRGRDVVDTFLRTLLEEVSRLDRNFIEPIRMTAVDDHSFQNATHCHLCKKPITDEKVRNHCHITGQYLGAAHSACNINYEVSKHVTVFFHNLSGYDCHYLMQGFGKYKGEEMSCIATTSKRFTGSATVSRFSSVYERITGKTRVQPFKR